MKYGMYLYLYSFAKISTTLPHLFGNVQWEKKEEGGGLLVSFFLFSSISGSPWYYPPPFIARFMIWF